MIVVLDASVVLKWFFRHKPGEDDDDRALSILQAIGSGHVRLIQPPHFVAEVAAVLAREKPETASDDFDDLEQIEWQLRDDPGDYRKAMDMASQLNHHLFDTLYHALALNTPGAIAVTADRRYYKRASEMFGQIMLLEDFALSA